MTEPIDVLGARLRDGMAAAERRPPWRRAVRHATAARHVRARAGWTAALAVALTLGGSTAIATRTGPWAPEPAKLPAAMRPGAVLPDRGGVAVPVADGVTRGIPWHLSASACDYGRLKAIGVFLTVPGGGGGARCDVAAQLPGADPRAIAARRVHSYFDPAAQRTWVFGALGATATSVDVRSRPFGGSATTGSRAVTRSVTVHGLPSGLRVFVMSLDGARDVPEVAVRDAAGRLSDICRSGRCAGPTGGAR
jgi:hypothetical protein